MKKVSIILLNWNGTEDTTQCLKSIFRLNTEGINREIIVVDNGSTDDSIATLKGNFSSIILLPLTENIGFTGGNNVGIDFANKNGADYCWILNNDTVVEKNSLIELVHAFVDDSVGIVGSKIYFMKDREFHHDRYKKNERGKVLWYAGGHLDWNNIYGSHVGVNEVDHGQYERRKKTDFVTGCSMMISRKCIEVLESFDTRYFAYLEDLDFSIRAVQAGFKLLYAPQSIVWHKNAGSTSRPGNLLQQYYITRNRILFGMRYASFRTKFALVRESLRLATSGNHTQRQAIVDAALGRWGKGFEWKK